MLQTDARDRRLLCFMQCSFMMVALLSAQSDLRMPGQALCRSKCVAMCAVAPST